MLPPHRPPSLLRYASQQDLTIMRKVYDFCSQRGVYPALSQFNRIMDWYTVEFRFGEVVSLACDMVCVCGGGVSPWAVSRSCLRHIPTCKPCIASSLITLYDVMTSHPICVTPPSPRNLPQTYPPPRCALAMLPTSTRTASSSMPASGRTRPSSPSRSTRRCGPSGFPSCLK